MRAPEPESRGADPVRVFVILAAFLVAIGAFFWLTRSGPSPDSEATPTSATGSPDFSLTDAEAIARFKELDALRIDLLRNRDQSLLSEVFVSGSPAEKRLVRTLSLLRDERTFFRSRSKTMSLSIAANSGNVIEVTQVVLVYPRFVNEKGQDVTAGRNERQTVDWEMRLFRDRWFLYDGLLTDVEKI